MHYLILAFVLMLQNFSFTFVSRARNSGSVMRHLVAAIFSNGIYMITWFYNFDLIKHALDSKKLSEEVFVIGFYTVFTVIGALVAHYYLLSTEKGKGAVGSNNRYAQITKEEWEKVRLLTNSIAPQQHSTKYA